MKKVLYIILVLGFSLTIISCAEKEESDDTDDSSTMITPSIADGTYKLIAATQKTYSSNGTLGFSYAFEISHDSSVTPGYLALIMEWKGSGVYRYTLKGKATLSTSGLDTETINCTTNGIEDVILDTDGNVTNSTNIQTGCGGSSSSSTTTVSQKFTPITSGFTYYVVLKDPDSREYQLTYTFQKQSTSTSTLTCTGTSSGSGPTIGSVALEEATYLSTCFSGMKIQLEFKNSTEAQYTHYTYGDSSCSGTASDTVSFCMNEITVSSTAVAKPTWNNDNGNINSDNVSGYLVYSSWKHSTDPMYLQFAADNASVFYYNQSESVSGRDSNVPWIFKFTKQ